MSGNTTQYWLEMADYDLETAKAMLSTKRYLYVGFMCHQTIEKAFKAAVVNKTGETPPYTHSLLRLSKAAQLYDALDESQQEFLDMLEPLNIAARYPTDKDRLFASLDENRCTKILRETEDLFRWIQTIL